ncbi:hypothetical protein [Paenibacillus xanthanilyticus]|uniref:Uncharacterized protein n=1 Tax=Paenibacillus xanthanilyticus TaxID=1783531 RepID=A0ABV8K8N6_9BACL
MLSNEIISAQQRELDVIDKKSSWIAQHLASLISDKQLQDTEKLTLAVLIEDFRGIIDQYGSLSLLNQKAGDDLFNELRTSFGFALDAVSISPSSASLENVSAMVEAITVFKGNVAELKNRS